MKHLAFPFLLWLLLAFFALSVASSGCKKDDQPDTAFDRSKVIGTWIEKEYWTDDDLDGIFTLHSEPCDGDAEYTFQSEGTYGYFDATPCDLPSALDLSGEWATVGTAPHIQIKLDGLEDEPIDLMVDAVSETDMTLHTIWPSDPAAKVQDKIVLKRK